jgi:hypothetical protein
MELDAFDSTSSWLARLTEGRQLRQRSSIKIPIDSDFWISVTGDFGESDFGDSALN